MSKQKKQHTGLHRVLLVLTSILLVVALAANVAGVYFAETIDNYVTGTHLDTSEKATAAVMETGEKVAEQIAAEGAVLLKNDGALPLASDVTKVNVFGWGSTQWLEVVLVLAVSSAQIQACWMHWRQRALTIIVS